MIQYRHVRKLRFYNVCMGVVLGLTGQLYLQIPSLGTIPMLDIFSYATAPVFLAVFWSRMGRYMQRAILWGLAWSLASVFANFLSDYDFIYALKSIVIVCSSWTIMTIAWWVLRQDARVFLWYLVGSAIGGFIGLYHFQPGTVAFLEYKTGIRAVEVLVDKILYATYAKLIIAGALLPLCIFWRKIPSLVVILCGLGAGVYLLFNGGARSNFGIYACASLVGFGVCYMRKTAIKMANHAVVLFVIAGVGVILLYGLYAHWAQSGALGESERMKFEAEEDVALDSGESRMATRGGFSETLSVIKSKPWGEGGTNKRHSVISNSLNCEGFVGLAFWVYFSLSAFWLVKNRIVYSGRFSFFIMQIVMGLIWAMLGSPFGGRHGYFALMAFVALCRDNPQYGAGTIFEPDYLMQKSKFRRL